jgi:enoyl-CoA hydratase/carnithine racemase
VPLKRCVVEKVDQCVVVRLVSENKEDRLNPEFVQDFHRALDETESYEDAACMVTISDGKHYSLGLDVDLLSGGVDMIQYLFDVQKLYRRLLTFPMVTVAAANGHIYAAGALFGLCHDYIIMNHSKGFFCLPEVNLRVNFPAAWIELAKARLPQREHRLAVVLGKRYSGEEAEKAGIVDELSPPDELRAAAIAAAGRLAGQGLDRRSLSTLKYDLYRDIAVAMAEPPRYYSPIPIFVPQS